MKQEVQDFLDFLKTKVEKQKKKEKQKVRQFGVLKGKIFLSDDFDEPLDEFKDYM